MFWVDSACVFSIMKCIEGRGRQLSELNHHSEDRRRERHEQEDNSIQQAAEVEEERPI